MDALFPIHCLGCGGEGSWVCADCRSAIRITPMFLCAGCGKSSPGGATHGHCRALTPLDALVSPYHYADPLLRGLVKEFKYHGAADIEKALSSLTASAARSWQTLLPARATVVVMPLHAARERMRGFNQAASIAAALAQTLGLAVAHPLTRTRRTEEQAQLTVAERSENCRRAFVSIHICGEIILVDDVVTSGATIAAAAAELKKAGATRVTGFTFAHGQKNFLAR